jgi:hypothetical protein
MVRQSCKNKTPDARYQDLFVVLVLKKSAPAVGSDREPGIDKPQERW